MSYSKNVYDTAIAKLQERHSVCALKNRERRDSLAEANPRFAQIEAELKLTSSKLASAIRNGMGMDTFNLIMDENKSLQAERVSLLKSLGLPENFLDETYYCSKCNDELYIDGKMCDCLKKELRMTAYNKLNETAPLKLTSFKDFDLGFYSNTPDGDDESPREIMSTVFSYVKKYAHGIKKTRESLLFMGGTGLGKTHLSLAVAKDAIDAGLGVIYDSVPTLMMKLESERFGRSDEGVLDSVCDCDLLILDDLGAEHTTATTRAMLYTIINSRIMSGSPTIISTNKSLTELMNQYSDAIYSRLSGDYTPILFCGSDIRPRKRLGMKYND